MKVARLVFFSLIFIALTACTGITPAVLPTDTVVTPAISVANRPGLVLQGKVTLDGRPLEGVKIYRSFASYPGEVVATTGKDGTYRSEFMYIPGDEMVTVWAGLEGYTFEPEKEFWRHYHSYEVRTVDFKATPSQPPPNPQ